MPRTTNNNFKANKNASTCLPIFLYTIFNYDGSSNNLVYANYDTNIVFDGVTYIRFPIAHSNIAENATGQIDSISLTISNVNRIWQAYFELYDLRGKKVTITKVFSDQLADTACKMEETYYIDSYSADEETITLNLTSKFDILDVVLPCRYYNRNHCFWTFGSTECGHTISGGETCNKTLTQCKNTYANQARFGGFPSIPARRIFY
jgi:lambda family phage minor tail protein L